MAKHGGIRGSPLFTAPIAYVENSQIEYHPAFNKLHPNIQKSIQIHEQAHQKGYGEIGAYFAQVKGILFFASNIVSILGLSAVVFHFIGAHYAGLAGFISTFSVGLIGMTGFAVGIFFLWKKVSEYHNAGSDLNSRIVESYNTYNNSSFSYEEFRKRIITKINEITAVDQARNLSPLNLLARIPILNRLIANKGNTWTGGKVLKALDWVLNIPTMLILYTFFLIHPLIPAGLALNAYSLRLSDDKFNSIVKEVASELSNQPVSSTKKLLLSLKDIVTLKYILNFSDDNIVYLSSKLKNANSKFYKILLILPLGFFIFTRAFFSLLTQRLVIGIAGMYIAPLILGLLFTPAFLTTVLVDLSFYLRGVVIKPYSINDVGRPGNRFGA